MINLTQYIQNNIILVMIRIETINEIFYTFLVLSLAGGNHTEQYRLECVLLPPVFLQK